MTLRDIIFSLIGYSLGWLWLKCRDRRRKKQDQPVSPFQSTIKGITIPLKREKK